MSSSSLGSTMLAWLMVEAILGRKGGGGGGVSNRQGAFVRGGRLIQTLHFKGGGGAY